MKGRKSIGRQKIPMEKIEAKTNLQVTFSKRRTGLFNKAAELSVLSGAQIAVLVLSPKEKPYTFAHPDLNTVLTAYLNNDHTPSSFNSTNNNNNNNKLTPCDIKKFNDEYDEALKEIEKLEKEKEKMTSTDHRNNMFWWESLNEDDMSYEELEEYVKALEGLERNIKATLQQRKIDVWKTIASAATYATTTGGGSSSIGAGGGGSMPNMIGGEDHQHVFNDFGHQGNNWI
ncbi:hypothetical protein ACFE04_004541 [Oxalis oulophora]